MGGTQAEHGPSAAAEVRELAARIDRELQAALAAGEDPRRGHEGLRLRRLLNLTEQMPGPVRLARRELLRAIGRSEIGDQLRRCGS